MSNKDDNSQMITSSEKILNFNQYESHLDNIINQYKSHLDSIKNIRENRNESTFSLDNVKNLNPKIYNRSEYSINSNDQSPINNSSNNKFDFLKSGTMVNNSKLSSLANLPAKIEKISEKSKEKDTDENNYIKINKIYKPKNIENFSNNENSNNYMINTENNQDFNLNYNYKDKNFEESDKNLFSKIKKNDQSSLLFNYDYKSDLDNKSKSNLGRNSKFGFLNELNSLNSEKPHIKGYNFDNFTNVTNTTNKEVINKDDSEWKNLSGNIRQIPSDKPLSNQEKNYEIDEDDDYKSNRSKNKDLRNLNYNDRNNIREKEKKRLKKDNNYDEDYENHEFNHKEKKFTKFEKFNELEREYDGQKDREIGREKIYDERSSHPREKLYKSTTNRNEHKENNEAFDGKSSRYSMGRENEMEKYKYNSTNNIPNERLYEEKKKNFNDEDLIEENRSLVNKNSAQQIKIKNLELEIKNGEEKYKNLEKEVENMNEKLNDMENHYLKILKEKDESIYALNRKISQLEKEDVKSINLKIALFKNLKLFFLNHLKDLKISEEMKMNFEDTLNSDNYDNINFNLYNKLIGNFDYFLGEILNENKDLKKGFDLFDEKIKKYEKDHIEKIKRNEEIIDDLKTENKILKNQLENKRGIDYNKTTNIKDYNNTVNNLNQDPKKKKKKSNSCSINTFSRDSNYNDKKYSASKKNNILDESKDSFRKDLNDKLPPKRNNSKYPESVERNSDYRNEREITTDYKNPKTRNTSNQSNNNSIAEHLNNNKYDKYSKFSGYEDYSKTEKREYERSRENCNKDFDKKNYAEIKKDKFDVENSEYDFANYDKYYNKKFPNLEKNREEYNYSNLYEDDEQKNSEKMFNLNRFDHNKNFNTDSIDDEFTLKKSMLARQMSINSNNVVNKFNTPSAQINTNFNTNNNNSFEFPIVATTPSNYDPKTEKNTRNSNLISGKDNYNLNMNYRDEQNFSRENLNNANMTGYNPIRLNEVSNNSKKIQNIDIKINNIPTSGTADRSPGRRFDEKSVTNDFKMLDKLKNKIKDLESKIGEINNDDKDKKIIDSMREYRAKNMTSI